MVRLSSTAGAAALLTLALRLRTVGAMFSVHEDLLAYPQYEVRFPDSPDSYITEEEADRRIASMSLRTLQQIPTSSTSSQSTNPTDGSSESNSGGSPDPEAEMYALQQRQQQGDKPGSGARNLDVIYEAMVMNNKRYLCSIPLVSPPPKLNATERRKNKSEEDKEVARATVSGTELLRGMEGTCLYFISGWWSYSFCYNDHIKQFHQLPPANGIPTIPPLEDPHAASYILGRAAVPDRDAKPDMPKEGTVMEMQANGELKYLVQKLAGGTLCDITGKERRIELQYHCSPNAMQDRIGYIKEVTTCCYLMVIYTPRLCSDAAFKPPAESRSNTIECLEVMNEQRIKEYQAESQRREQNLQNLLEIVGQVGEGIEQKLPSGTGGKGSKIFVPKPSYKIRPKNEKGKFAHKKGEENGEEKIGDQTYIVTGEDGREQVMMVHEMEMDADMLKNLPEGVEIVDIEELARLAEAARAQAGVGRPVEVDARMMQDIQRGRQGFKPADKDGKEGKENNKKEEDNKGKQENTEKKEKKEDGHDEL